MKTFAQPPQLAQPVGKVVEFLRTVMRVLVQPRAFFAAQHAEASGGARAGAPPLKRYLAMAVALSAAVGPLHHALLRAGGFPEHFIQLVQRRTAELWRDYGRAIGYDISVIDLGQLTGLSLIDRPVADLARLGGYVLIGALFWVFSRKRLPLALMTRYFAYTVGACWVLNAVLVLAGDALFLLSAGSGPLGSFGLLFAVHQFGDLPRFAYLFVVPCVILPGIVGVPRRTVIWATILAWLTFVLGGLLIMQLMLATGFLILAPIP